MRSEHNDGLGKSCLRPGCPVPQSLLLDYSPCLCRLVVVAEGSRGTVGEWAREQIEIDYRCWNRTRGTSVSGTLCLM